jgi:hypothetical protein
VTRPLSQAGHLAGLAAANKVFVKKVKEVTAAMPTGGKSGNVGSRKIPPTVISYVRGGIGYVNAGGPGGLSAPNAYMFEVPDRRHPLFAHGPRGTDGWKKWYDQKYIPFLEIAADAAEDDAVEAYLNAALDVWIKEAGLNR